jgi:RNA polymerase sigma-70 factor (ECF subfamily)
MNDTDASLTSVSLLGRLRHNPNDQRAWCQFVDRYGRKIYGWCRQWRLQEADAQDVTQNVLAELARELSAFEYRPSGSFRGWLRTVVYRAWCDYLRQRQREVQGTGGDAVFAQLSSVAAGEDLLRQLNDECDRELLEEAMARVRLRVQPHTWQAFVLTAIEGRSGAEVAATLRLRVGTVWVARSKVQKMLQEEVRRLEDEGERRAGSPLRSRRGGTGPPSRGAGRTTEAPSCSPAILRNACPNS